MNHQTEQASLNLYDKVYKDNQGVVAYPWRVSAGHKFEAMGAMAFFQSQMNNHHLVREYYKSSDHSSQIKVQMIHGDNSMYDLRYRINYNEHQDVIIRRIPDKMRVEFKLITFEALQKHGFEGSIANIFKPYQGKNKRAFDFLDCTSNHNARNGQIFKLLVIGMTRQPSHVLVPLSTADAFEQIICVGYMRLPASPNSHKSLETKKVVCIFHSFSEYAKCIHDALSPLHLYRSMVDQTHVDHTVQFINQFGLP